MGRPKIRIPDPPELRDLALSGADLCQMKGKTDFSGFRALHFLRCSVLDIKDSLFKCLEFWKSLNIPLVILKVIADGYNLPFSKPVPSIFCKNNSSAFRHASFVGREIDFLLSKGIIFEIFSPPSCVNALSVAENGSKLRMVLDCSLLNEYILRYRFKLENVSSILPYLNQGSFMVKLDLKQGYYHVPMSLNSQKYLGFGWIFNEKTRFFCFSQMPFGLSSAPHIFTKILRPFLLRWRRSGFQVSVYLDDFFAAANDFILLKQQIFCIVKDLTEAGFIINVEKSSIEPVQEMEYLGFLFNTISYNVSIPQNKFEKILCKLDKCIGFFPEFSARTILSLAGVLVSNRLVFGDLVLLRTRSFYQFVGICADWDSLFMANSYLLKDLQFWKENLSYLATRSLQDKECKFLEIFSDASSFACAAVFNNQGKQLVAYHRFDVEQKERSSTWRELFAIKLAIECFYSYFAGFDVKIFVDNQAVPYIVRKGSMKEHLQCLALQISELCSKYKIGLYPIWIPREHNALADFYSKCKDYDDWAISPVLFSSLCKIFGSPTLDIFASSENSKTPRFFSRFWCPDSVGADCFNYRWNKEFCWAVPPFNLIPKTLQHFHRFGNKMLLLVPFWPSAIFWPLITPHSPFFKYIKKTYIVDAANRFIIPGSNSNLCFSQPAYNFKMLALLLEK